MNIELNRVVKIGLVGIYFFLGTLACNQHSPYHQVVDNDTDHFFYSDQVYQVTEQKEFEWENTTGKTIIFQASQIEKSGTLELTMYDAQNTLVFKEQFTSGQEECKKTVLGAVGIWKIHIAMDNLTALLNINIDAEPVE